MAEPQARVNPEGFVAQRLTIGEDTPWVLSYMSHDQFAVRMCTDDEVADWPELRVIETPGPSPVLTVSEPDSEGRVTASCSCGTHHVLNGSHDEALAWWYTAHLPFLSEHPREG